MRILLFTGKGGVGKTTLAAATAASLAARGRKTLVVSTDPAHSLGDAFATVLGGEPSEVDTPSAFAGGPGGVPRALTLHAAQIDSRALVDDAWAELRGQLRGLLAGAGVDALDAEELTVVPGVDELLALTEVRRLAEAGPWENVVVDCGPTAETLRLLSLPEAVSGYLGRLRGRGGLGRSVRRFATHLAGLRTLLTDPSVTTVRLVLTPERLVVAETRRTLSSLALRGIAVDGLIVNRLMPAPGRMPGSAAAWLRTRRAQQDAVLTELTAAGLERSLRRVEHRAVEPVGLPALLEIAGDLYGAEDPLARSTRPVGPLLSVAETEGGHELRVGVPLSRSAKVDLARVGDDLAITVDGVRRLIALPELLRPCRITGAESDSAGLVVQLAPAGGA